MCAKHKVSRLAEQIQEILNANTSEGPVLSAIRWPITSSVSIRKAIAAHARSGEVHGSHVQAEVSLFVASVPNWRETLISVQFRLKAVCTTSKWLLICVSVVRYQSYGQRRRRLFPQSAAGDHFGFLFLSSTMLSTVRRMIV